MALHPQFPDDPHAILDPTIRWFPADEAFREGRPFHLLEEGRPLTELF